MRLTCTVLAVLMLAACPPRRSRVVYVPVQPYVVQPVVVSAPPVVVAQAPLPHEPRVRASDPAVEAILVEWERKMEDVGNLRTSITLKRTDAVFRKDTNYGGSVLWMKPNFAILRLDNLDDPKKVDYEAYICNSKSIFAYNGVQKTITKIELRNDPQANEAQANDPLRQWLSSLWPINLVDQMPFIMTMPKELSARFDITLFKTDEHYIYLDLQPRTDAGMRQAQRMRVALYGPGPATEKYAYLPAQVYVLNAGGNTEVWRFTDPKVNLPDVSESNFAFVPVKGRTVRQVP